MSEKRFDNSRKIIKEYSLFKLKERMGSEFEKTDHMKVMAAMGQLENEFFSVIEDEFEVEFSSNIIEEAKLAKEVMIREGQEEKNELVKRGKQESDEYASKVMSTIYKERDKMVSKKLISFIAQGIILAGIIGLLVNQFTESIGYLKDNSFRWSNIPIWVWTQFWSAFFIVIVALYVVIVWVINKVELINNFKKEIRG